MDSCEPGCIQIHTEMSFGGDFQPHWSEEAAGWRLQNECVSGYRPM